MGVSVFGPIVGNVGFHLNALTMIEGQ